MAPKDGIVDTLREYSKEMSPIIIEPTEKVNIKIEVEPKIIHLAQSLTLEEREKFIHFFQERQINFACPMQTW